MWRCYLSTCIYQTLHLKQSQVMCDFSIRFEKCDVRRGVFLWMIGSSLKILKFVFISFDPLKKFRQPPCLICTFLLFHFVIFSEMFSSLSLQFLSFSLQLSTLLATLQITFNRFLIYYIELAENSYFTATQTAGWVFTL